MVEMVWAALIVLLLFLASASLLVPWIELVEAGRWLMLTGVVAGIPLQILYFLLLGTFLTVSGNRPRRWYWRPFDHHDLLESRQKVLVLPFYFAGACAFLIAILGMLLIAAGVIGALGESA